MWRTADEMSKRCDRFLRSYDEGGNLIPEPPLPASNAPRAPSRQASAVDVKVGKVSAEGAQPSGIVRQASKGQVATDEKKTEKKEYTGPHAYLYHYHADATRKYSDAVAFVHEITGAFTEICGDPEPFRIFDAVCRYQPPVIRFNEAEWRRNTAVETDKVMGHLWAFQGHVSLYDSICSPKSNNPLENVISMLDNIGEIDTAIVGFLSKNKALLSRNAGKLRTHILRRVRSICNSGFPEVDEANVSLFHSSFKTSVDSKSNKFRKLVLQSPTVESDTWSGCGMVASFVALVIEATDAGEADEWIKKFETKAVEQELDGISTAEKCIQMMNDTYRKYTDNLRKTSVSEKEKLLQELRRMAVNMSLKDRLGREEEIPPGGEITHENSGFVLETNEAIAIFLWELILERIEVLWSNVYTLFISIFAGNRKKARGFTNKLMSHAIRRIVSPLFRRDPLHKKWRSSLQATIDGYYEYYGNGDQKINALIETLVPQDISTIESGEDMEMLNEQLDRCLLRPKSSGNPGYRYLEREPDFSRLLIGKVGSLMDTLFEGTLPLGCVVNIPKDFAVPRGLKLHRLVYHSNKLRDLIQKELVEKFCSTPYRYKRFRQVLRLAFQYDGIFFAKYMVSKDTRTLINHRQDLTDYARLYLLEQKNPLSIMFDPQEKKRITDAFADAKGGLTAYSVKQIPKLVTATEGKDEARREKLTNTFKLYPNLPAVHPSKKESNPTKKGQRPVSASAKSRRRKA
jgi:hypothetical protein